MPRPKSKAPMGCALKWPAFGFETRRMGGGSSNWPRISAKPQAASFAASSEKPLTAARITSMMGSLISAGCTASWPLSAAT